MAAETCGSNIVVTKKHTKTIYLSQVGHGMPYFAGARVQQVMDWATCLTSLPKVFFLWSKKVSKPLENKFCKAV